MRNNYLSQEEFKKLLYSGLLNRFSSNHNNNNLNFADNVLNIDDEYLDLDLKFYLSLRKDVRLMKLNPIMHILENYKMEASIQDFILDQDLVDEEKDIYIESNRMMRVDQKVNFTNIDSEFAFKDFELQREVLSVLNNSLFYP